MSSLGPTGYLHLLPLANTQYTNVWQFGVRMASEDQWRKERLFPIELNEVVIYLGKDKIGHLCHFTYIRI